MKKTTTIVQCKSQTRSTIPQAFVDDLKITKKDQIEWELKKDKLKGELKRK